MSVFERLLAIADEETLDLASVRKEARGNKTEEAAERCTETGTFPKVSDIDGQSVSMIVR
jgi:hypothetical protein